MAATTGTSISIIGNGNEAAPDCPCIDSSRILSSQSNCIRPEDGSPGVWIPFSSSGKNQTDASSGACYPLSYGANECAAHDMVADPRCMVEDHLLPGYCQESFCYVDRDACKLSSEYFFLSTYFDDLYYSYGTCNSTEDDWLDFDSTNKLEGLKLSVVVPAIVFPNHYKISTTTGQPAEFRATEYYDDNIPWEGFFLDYFNDIVSISNVGEISYTYQSKGSDNKSPGSMWTATVHDVQAGISCLALSNFWITAERLKLTTFTTPIATEKLHMWIQSPAAEGISILGGSSLAENVAKTLAPFEPQLWFLTLGILVFVAVLSVVFANQQGELSLYWERMRSQEWEESNYWGRAQIFAKMGLESFLLKSTYAVTQSAGINTHNSMAQKFINVGFAFFILILVSAYTANLAAFLTVSLAEQVGYIKDIQDAIARGVWICAYFALKDDLSRDFPDANFLYFQAVEEQLEAYDTGRCSVILYTFTDLVVRTQDMTEFCKRDLVMTGPPVLEIAVGFPVCADLAAGISHWIYEAQKRGIVYTSYFEQNLPEPVCSFDIPEETGDSDMARLSVEDFALPLLVFLGCIGLAVLSHVYDLKTRKDEEQKAQERGTHNHGGNSTAVAAVTTVSAPMASMPTATTTWGQQPKTECARDAEIQLGMDASEINTESEIDLGKDPSEMNAEAEIHLAKESVNTVMGGDRKDCMAEIEIMLREDTNRMLEKIAAVVAKQNFAKKNV